MPDHAEFHGVLPALITPFTDDGAAIDADALAAIVERLIHGGVAGSCRAAAPASSRRSPTRSDASWSRSPWRPRRAASRSWPVAGALDA